MTRGGRSGEVRAAHTVDASWRKGSPLAFIVIGSILTAVAVFWLLSRDAGRATATPEDGAVTMTKSTASTSS